MWGQAEAESLVEAGGRQPNRVAATAPRQAPSPLCHPQPAFPSMQDNLSPPPCYPNHTPSNIPQKSLGASSPPRPPAGSG
jgi:hypothetical protein